MENNQPVIRSISLPSREHPCSVRIEALLNHLKSFQFSSPQQQASFFESHTIIQNSLVGLAELYNCLDEFMNTPSTQQALMPLTTRHCESENPLVEQALEGSITLLDTCNAARDVLLTMSQHVQTLQSALRRKGGGDSSVEANIHSYLCFRKKAKKDIIAKCFAGLKRMENNNNMAFSELSNQEYDMSMIVKVLRETSSITISIFRSLLRLLSTSSSTSTKAINGWSLISKLIVRKRLLVSSEKEVEKVNVNLVAKVDVSLHSLLESIQSNNDDIARSEAVQLSQRMLETLNSSSESLVVGLDCMFRCLVQNRVSLLNIITQ